jgi:hypothetical protein
MIGIMFILSYTSTHIKFDVLVPTFLSLLLSDDPCESNGIITS